MKIRSIVELENALSQESSWRKKELIDIRLHVRSAQEPAQRALRRAGFALTYAHWEGFAKSAFDFYLTYVRTRGHAAEALSDAFAALALGKYMRQLYGVPVEAHLPLALGELRSGRAGTLPSNDFVHAAGNLHSGQLKTMLATFGLDSAQYETRFIWLDTTLVKGRNEIAHGRGTAPSLDDFLDTVDRVLSLMDELHTQVSNAAALKQFARAAPQAPK